MRQRHSKKKLVTKPSILVHGEQYYYVRDDQQLYDAYLHILRTKIAGRIFRDPPMGPGFNLEDLDKELPQSLRKAAFDLLTRWRRDLKTWEEEREELRNLRRIVEEKDGRQAQKILHPCLRKKTYAFHLEPLEEY